MAKNPKAKIEATTPEQIKVAQARLQQAYESHLEKSMEHLYNRFVAFIAESRLPLPQVFLVLQMLVTATIRQSEKKYLGET